MNLKILEQEQIKLAQKVLLSDSFEDLKLIAGCDQAFTQDKTISAIVLCDRDMKVIEVKHSVIETKMPYIPNFLAFREAPAVMEAYSKLEKRPDLLLADGNGLLHPRRFGLASHLGVTLGIPTIGIAKSLLCGKVDNSRVYLDKEVVGFELKTREHAKPVYISPGHMVSLKTSIELVKKMIKQPHKLPEPLHLAHKEAEKIRKEIVTKAPSKND